MAFNAQEELYDNFTKKIQKYMDFLDKMLNTSIYSNESSEYKQIRKQLSQLLAKDRDSVLTTEVPLAKFDEFMAKAKSLGLACAPMGLSSPLIDDKGNPVEKAGYRTVAFPAVQKEAVTKIWQSIPMSMKNISRTSIADVLDELQANNIVCSYTQHGNVYSVQVAQEDAKTLDNLAIKYEGMSRDVGFPLDKIIEKHLQDKGIYYIKDVNPETKLPRFQYSKIDAGIIEDAIQTYQTNGFRSPEVFNRENENKMVQSFKLNDEIEVNKFLDLAVGKKLTYTITEDKQVCFLSKHANIAESIKDEMLEDLYAPGNRNKYIDAVVDAKIQNDIMHQIKNNKHDVFHFISATNPDLYIEVNGTNDMKVVQRMENTSGEIISAELFNFDNMKDLKQVGGFLSYLGTPIAVPEEEFFESKIAPHSTHYKELIESTLKEVEQECSLGFERVPNEHAQYLKKIYEEKKEYFADNPNEVRKILEEKLPEEHVDEFEADYNTYKQKKKSIEDSHIEYAVAVELGDIIKEYSQEYTDKDIDLEIKTTKTTTIEHETEIKQ